MDGDVSEAEPEAVERRPLLASASGWLRVRRWARERWAHWTTHKRETMQNAVELFAGVCLSTFFILHWYRTAFRTL